MLDQCLPTCRVVSFLACEALDRAAVKCDGHFVTVVRLARKDLSLVLQVEMSGRDNRVFTCVHPTPQHTHTHTHTHTQREGERELELRTQLLI